MQNIKELKELLLTNLKELENDKRSISKAKEITNGAGKFLGVLKIELEYQKHLGIVKPIKFLEYET